MKTFLQNNTDLETTPAQIGQLALEYCHVRLSLQVYQSNAGFYIGTWGDEGPCSRESMEYFKTRQKAEEAFATGNWTQRDHP
jgi:hypothetical protein